MTIYLINIALILFWRLFFTEKRFANAKKLFCWTVAIQWILISGLRDWSVGSDTYNYYIYFEQTKNQSWASLFQYIYRSVLRVWDGEEWGYTLLMKVFQIFFQDYQLFLVGIAAIFMGLMARWVYKYSSSPCTSFIIFSTLFYSFYALTGHRQTIATALIVFVGYDLIRERKFWRFAGISLVAFLIHKSSVMFVPFYFLTMIPATFIYKWICAAGVTLFAMYGAPLYKTFALWLGYGENQVNYTKGGAELYALILVALCVVMWLFHPMLKKRREDADHLFHASSMALLSALMVMQNQNFMRIQQYYSLFIMITIPELINLVKREYRLLVYLAFGAVMIFYLVQNNPQYSFFFTR